MTVNTGKNNKAQKYREKGTTHKEENTMEIAETLRNMIDEIDKTNNEWVDFRTKVHNGEINILEYYESLYKKEQEEERIRKKKKRKEKLKNIVNSILKFFKIKE